MCNSELLCRKRNSLFVALRRADYPKPSWKWCDFSAGASPRPTLNGDIFAINPTLRITPKKYSSGRERRPRRSVKIKCILRWNPNQSSVLRTANCLHVQGCGTAKPWRRELPTEPTAESLLLLLASFGKGGGFCEAKDGGLEIKNRNFFGGSKPPPYTVR